MKMIHCVCVELCELLVKMLFGREIVLFTPSSPYEYQYLLIEQLY